MAYTIVKTESFENDYDDILEYLVSKLKAPQAALNLIGEVDKAIELLSETPFIHAVSNRPTLRARDAREHYIRNYVIVYWIENKEVVFARMFHQAQEYDMRTGSQ
ncbi:type II toxin-antitoxin system RelE/ParE family toxin [Raoultibacter phocaeensis]|uniref:type II toxin-antitoxin system RelE/ParE family toxin n=1 Tax=Raoultibacter phocaeensis TaxID=2479841 RepID=UPI00111AFBC7